MLKAEQQVQDHSVNKAKEGKQGNQEETCNKKEEKKLLLEAEEKERTMMYCLWISVFS